MPYSLAEVMLGEPGVVEAELVGAQDLAGDAGVHIAVRIGLGVDVGMGGEQDSEFHARASFCFNAIIPPSPRPRHAEMPRRPCGDRGWLPAAAADMFGARVLKVAGLMRAAPKGWTAKDP